MSQDSWEYSTWAQPEPSLPETEIRRLSLVVHPPEAFMCGAGDFHLDGSKPLPLYSDGAFDLDELVFAPELMMAGAGLDPNDSDVTLEPMMSAAGALGPNGPPPDPTDPKFGGDYERYRRAYKTAHQKEQRRKRRLASPLAAPRRTAPRHACMCPANVGIIKLYF